MGIEIYRREKRRSTSSEEEEEEEEDRKGNRAIYIYNVARLTLRRGTLSLGGVSVQRKFRRCDDEEARVSGRSRGPAAAFNRASQAVLTLASISRRRTACRRSTRIVQGPDGAAIQPYRVASSVAEHDRGPSAPISFSIQ